MVSYLNILRQALHGCRQLVLWDVWLIPATSATPFYILINVNTAAYKQEEGGDDVKSSWPLWIGLHTCYNGDYNRKQWCKPELICKNYPSSDCSLQLGSMKEESLVIVDQHATVNTSTNLVHTARHAMGVVGIWSLLCAFSLSEAILYYAKYNCFTERLYAYSRVSSATGVKS